MNIRFDPSRPLVLLGAGGQGRVAADLAETLGCADIVFLDDAWPKLSATGVWPVVGPLDAMDDQLARGRTGFVSLGANPTRRAAHHRLSGLQGGAPALVHPTAVVSRHALLSPGVLIAATAVVGPFTRLGEAVIVNTGASVDHDCELDEAVHVSPGARLSGAVKAGVEAWIGVGASVREGVVIAERAVIGAGAAVVGDIGAGQLVVGVPARPKART